MADDFPSIRFDHPPIKDDGLAGSNLLALPPELLKVHALLAGSLVSVTASDGLGQQEPVVLTVGVHFQKERHPRCDSQYEFLLGGPLTVSREISPYPPVLTVTLFCQEGTAPDDVKDWLILRGGHVNTHVLYMAGDSRFIFIDPSREDFSVRAVRVDSWDDFCVYEEGSSWKELWQNYQKGCAELESVHSGYCETRKKIDILCRECRHYQQVIREARLKLRLTKARADGLRNLIDCLGEKNLVISLSSFAEKYRQVVKGKTPDESLPLDDHPTRRALDVFLQDLFRLNANPVTVERNEYDLEVPLSDADKELNKPVATAGPEFSRVGQQYHQVKRALKSHKKLTGRIGDLGRLSKQFKERMPALKFLVAQNSDLAADLNSLQNEFRQKVEEIQGDIQQYMEGLEPFFGALKELGDIDFIEESSIFSGKFQETMKCTETAEAVAGFAVLLGRLEALATALEAASRKMAVIEMSRGTW